MRGGGCALDTSHTSDFVLYRQKSGIELIADMKRRTAAAWPAACDATETCMVEGCCSDPHFASVLQLRVAKWSEQVVVED
jgi:hypothetical protein